MHDTDDNASLTRPRPTQFFHPNITGVTQGTTHFQRLNEETDNWENAGEISWLSNYLATVYFGLEQVCKSDNIAGGTAGVNTRQFSLRDLRRQKK